MWIRGKQMPIWDDLIKQRSAVIKLMEELVEHGSNEEMLHECKQHYLLQ